jgi:hypothetical protein
MTSIDVDVNVCVMSNLGNGARRMNTSTVLRGSGLALMLLASSIASAQLVSSFTVVNADTGKDIATFAASGTVSIATTPHINLRANATGAGSVVFTDGVNRRVESSAPFSYMGDTNGVYNPWSPAPGTYDITASPFSGAGATGAAGAASTLRLTVTSTSSSTFTASGVVTGASWNSVTASFTGAQTATATTDSSGNFLLSGLADGNYVVTPSKTGYNFTPPSRNFTVANANVTGLNFSSAAGAPTGIQLWHPTVLSFTSSGTYTNPYMQASMTAVFTGPSGQTVTVPAYYEGGSNWRVRFSPTALGAWTWVTKSSDAGLNGKRGSLDCVANTNAALHGPLQVDPSDPNHLRYEDGTPYFQLAYEADWLGMMDLEAAATPGANAKALVDSSIAPNGFSEVLMNVYAYDTPWGTDAHADFGPTRAYPWAGTNAAPDHTRINPAYFDRFDAAVDYLFQNGITAHVMFMVFNKGVSWPKPGSAEDDQWIRYVTARYQAYPNIVWDYAKETYNTYSGVHYQNEAYVKSRLNLIKGSDGYGRLRTAHAPINHGAQASGLDYWFDVKPNELDFYTTEAVEGTGLYANTIASKAKTGAVPYANEENSYQIGNDGTRTYSGAHQMAADVHNDMMEVVMADAGVGYYYAYHAWDDVRVTEVPAGISFFKNLSAVFGQHIDRKGLVPSDGVIGGGTFGKHCLAIPGREYVVELSPAAAGTQVSVSVAHLPANAKLNATWYDLDTGASFAAGTVAADGTVKFSRPFTGVGLLVMR